MSLWCRALYTSLLPCSTDSELRGHAVAVICCLLVLRARCRLLKLLIFLAQPMHPGPETYSRCRCCDVLLAGAIWRFVPGADCSSS